MKRFYYTFGTDPAFPHGAGEYVAVEAESEAEADQKFMEVYPPRPGSSLLNCAFVYAAEKFEAFRDKYYKGVEPARVIK